MYNSQTIDKRLRDIEALLLSQKTILTGVSELSTYTGLSKSYLYKLSSTGGIPCYKPRGKVLYFERLELDKWLLSKRVKTSLEIEQEASTFVTLGKRG